MSVDNFGSWCCGVPRVYRDYLSRISQNQSVEVGSGSVSVECRGID